MSVAPPPPPRKTKGEPPAANDTLKTLPAGPERDTPLNFRVARTFKRDFKIAAAQRGITQVELLERLFQKIDEI